MRIINGVIIDEKERQGSVKALGAEGDGTRDETAQIQAAINRFPVIRFPPGVYFCNGLVIPSDKTLVGEDGAILQLDFPGSPPGAQQAITITGSNVEFKNLTIRGINSRWAAYIDLEPGDLEDIVFEGCKFLNLFRGIRVRSNNIAGRKLSHLHITNCVFKDFVDRAVDFLSSVGVTGQPYSLENVHIERNYFQDIAPNTSGKRVGDIPGDFDGGIYIGGLASVKGFYLNDNEAYRVGPQFLAMSATSNPREDFTVRGNKIKQEGSDVIINMGYTFNGVNNLIFSDNTTDFSDYELLFLSDCKNYKVSNCHFSRANVGIAIHERTATAESYGEISNCTFEDIETPSAENNGNKAILIIGDVARPDIVNCHFRKRNGVKGQTAIDFNFFTTPPTRLPRLPVQVNNCTFEGVIGIVMRSGGNANYPGNAKVLNCNFRKCPIGVSLTYTFGSYIAFCTFDQCDTDVRTKIETMAMRAFANTHIGTNPNNVAGNGAYVIEVGSGKSITQIEACDFRNVKGVYVLALGTLLQNVRLLIWNNNNADAGSSGVPTIGATVVKSL